MHQLFKAGLATLLLSTSALAQSGPAFELDEIIFTANAGTTEAERAGFSVEVIEGEELTEAGDLQLTDFLKRLPGIALSQQGPQGTAADIRIRGARSRYVSVYVDGILVTDPSLTETQFDDFGGLTTSGVRRIEILRGSQGALYGGTAVAGVINISTVAGDEAPEGLSQTARIEAGSHGTFSADYAMTQRTGDTILSFGISHAQSDGFSAADEDQGNTEADGFDRTRITFGAQTAVTEALTLGVNGFVEDGSAEFDDFSFVAPFLPIDGTPDDEQQREAQGLRLWGLYEAGAWEHELSLSRYRVRRDSTSGGFTSTFDGRRLAADYRATGQVSSAVKLSFGFSAQEEDARYANTPGGQTTVRTNGAFAEAVVAASDALDITGTVRFDDHSEFGGEATGRLGFAYRPGARTVIRGAVSTGYRPPSIDELFGDYLIFNFIGNPALQPEESRSMELGVDHIFANGATLSATVFALDIENLVTFQFGAPSTLINVPGTSHRRGIEIAGSFPIGERVTLNGAYTYTDAESATGAPLARVPEHDLVLGIEAMLTDELTATATMQHVTGLIDAGTSLSDFTVVDAQIAYEFREGLEAYLRVENVTDEAYQTILGYGTSDRAIYVGLRASY
ncbi:TonB-dependent receptor plug domain-containing protein [Ovoidimarina sediminis]|uniref:TonB-dependent receptor plug domain-containing protein n=1 Tax=Ovoidimarina sediminis TaxID=3079856 RepID=UPI002910D66A|nr:TonB-dependent receptor [Rhodophyticola sp. MJ-SS7]MDU8945152.1 TonB-dependent receptor [Rhodophyticola sp. MJ-SS7]